MSEIFEAVNTHANEAHLENLKRKEEARRQALANRKMKHVLIGCIIVWVLLAVLRALGHVSEDLAGLIGTWAGVFLAIWFGAWFQFRFCRKGLMK